MGNGCPGEGVNEGEARVWGVLLSFMQREEEEHYGFKTEKVESRRNNALGEIFGM